MVIFFYHGVKGEKYRFLLVGEELGDKSKGSRNCDAQFSLCPLFQRFDEL